MDDLMIENLGSKIRARFDLGEHVYATRTSEATEGVDREGAAEIFFWTLRHPLAVDSDAEERYIVRMKQISQLFESSSGSLPIPKIRAYGLDRSGIAYCVTEFFAGEPLAIVSDEPTFAVKAFREAVSIIAEFHRSGLVLGDICEESFLVNDSGAVRLVAILGSFELEANRTATLPPGSTLPYLSPEQRSGAPGDFRSDVFALGMLGYRLLTGRYPFGERIPANVTSFEELLNMAPAPSLVQPALPPWVDDLLGKCLELRPDVRFRSAEEFLAAIDASIRDGYATDGGGRWARRTVTVKPRNEAILTTKPVGTAGEFAVGAVAAVEAPRPTREGNTALGKLMVLASSGLALGVVVAALVFLFSQEGGKTSIDPSDFAAPDLKPSLPDLRSDAVSDEQKVVALQRLTQSDNAVSYSFLAQAIGTEQPITVKREGLRLLAQKMTTHGTERAATVFSEWVESVLATGRDPTSSPIFGLATKAADVTLPPDARKESLHRIFAEDRSFALRYSAALAIDDPDPDRFVPVLRQLLTASGNATDLTGKGLSALLVADRLLILSFDQDIVKLLPQISNADLAWTMSQIAGTDSRVVNELAHEAIRRKVVPPFQEVFLQILVDSDPYTIPRSVRTSLVRAAQAQIASNDVATFAGWLDISAEQALLATCAIATDKAVAVQAFDALTLKALRTEPARSLVGWIQKRSWDHREALVTAVGILGLSGVARQEQVDYALDQLMPFSVSGSLFEAVVKSGDARLIVLAIDRMSAIVATKDLITLLEHARSDVRIASIRALSDRNDITEMQRILRIYEREKDDAVRQVYRDSLWVVRNRGKGR